MRRIRLSGTYHLIDVNFTRLDVFQLNPTSKSDLARSALGRIDDYGVRQDLVDLDDSALDPCLLGLGIVVLGVLRKIP
jgi:hypothetical protein